MDPCHRGKRGREGRSPKLGYSVHGLTEAQGEGKRKREARKPGINVGVILGGRPARIKEDTLKTQERG